VTEQAASRLASARPRVPGACTSGSQPANRPKPLLVNTEPLTKLAWSHTSPVVLAHLRQRVQRCEKAARYGSWRQGVGV
jgi:hypothetical protein